MSAAATVVQMEGARKRGAGREPVGTSVAWLAGYAVVFVWAAARAYRREAERKFG